MPVHFDSITSAPITRADGWALLRGAVFAGVLLSPLRHYVGSIEKVNRAKDEHDSFPLSTYPMFAIDRRGQQGIRHVVGFTADGVRVPLHYNHYGRGGLNQVRRQVNRAARSKDAVKVAQHYADSLAKRPRPREREVEEVAVVRSRFVFDDYFGVGPDGTAKTPDTNPASEKVLARCAVGGTATRGRTPRNKPTDR